MTARLLSPRGLTLLVLGLGLLAVLACNLPGQLSYDGVVQLADARTGRYHTWHPAVMAWLLGIGDAVLPGTALYVTGVASVIFAALAALVVTAPRVGWGGPMTALLICASPLMLLEQGIVWKDVLFADASVSAFLLLAVVRRPGRSARGRALLLGAAFLLLVLAALVRQNGVIVCLFAAAALALLVWDREAARDLRLRLLRAAGAGAAALVAVLIVTALANAGLMTRRAADDVGAGGQIRLLKLYDLVGVLKRDPTLDLSPLAASGLDVHLRAALPLYTPLKNDTISEEPGIDAAIAKGAPGLDAAWRGAILHHTRAWLGHRLEVFRWIFAPHDVTRCTATYAGVDGPPELMAQLNIQSQWRGQDVKIGHYAQAFVHTPLYSHAFWAVVAAVLAVLLALRRRPEDGVLALMLGAALAYAATYLVIGIACDHRYLYALDLACSAALLHLAADPRRILPRRAPPSAN